MSVFSRLATRGIDDERAKQYANGNSTHNPFWPLAAETPEDFRVRLLSCGVSEFLFYSSEVMSVLDDGEIAYVNNIRELAPSTRGLLVEFEFFIGWYNRTAGGVHKEPCDNRHLVIHGQKTMLVWTPASLSAQRNDLNKGDEVYLKDVPVRREDWLLKGNQGTLFVWPAGYWHVGSSPEISAAINLACYAK